MVTAKQKNMLVGAAIALVSVGVAARAGFAQGVTNAVVPSATVTTPAQDDKPWYKFWG